MLVYIWLGLGIGGLYALLGLGLITLHKGSGVVNLGLGATAMVSAFSFSRLQPDLGTVGATIIAVAISALVGVASYLLVMRPLRGAPPLAMLVATLGLLLVLQSGVLLLFNDSSIVAPDAFGDEPFIIAGAAIQPIRVYLLVAAIVIAIGLAAIFAKTRFGVYTRAASESEKGLTLLGRSPMTIAVVNWALGSAIAGLAGVGATRIVGLQIENLILLIVPALAVALLARFTSFLLAVVAAVGLGVAEALISGYWSHPEYKDIVPFTVLVILLMVTGRAIPDRGTLTSSVRTPEVTPARPTPVALISACLALIGLFVLDGPYQSALIISMIIAVIAISLVLITGFVGQVSLVQFVLAGIGGYTTSRVAFDLGWPFPIPMILAVIVSAAFGLLLGIPSLRVRGFNLAVLTIAAAVTVQSAVFNNLKVTGGAGGNIVPSPQLGDYSLDPFLYPVRFGVLVFVMLLACGFGVMWLRNSRLGLRLLAVRDNERAAAAVGWSVTGTKLVAFTISAGLAGLGGSLLVYQAGIVVSTQFTPLASILFVGYVYVAGIGSLGGAMLAGLSAPGGLIVTWLQFALPVGNVQYWANLILAAMLLLAVVAVPDGIVPFHGRPLRHLDARVAKSLRRRFGGLTPASERVPVPAAEPSKPAPASTRRRRNAGGDETRGQLLRVDDLSVHFGAVAALDQVDLVVKGGLVTGLIGPNGSGKTTFVDAVSGFVKSEGQIEINETDVSGWVPHLRVRHGVARSFQGLELFEQLTVFENVACGVRKVTSDQESAATQVEAELERLDLESVAGKMPGEITPGQRRLVAIARALVSRPDLLILDEPASGLDHQERETLRSRLHELADEGASTLLIEHDVNLVFDVCDYVHVFDQGRVIASGLPEVVRRDPAVITAYLGDTAADDARDDRPVVV